MRFPMLAARFENGNQSLGGIEGEDKIAWGVGALLDESAMSDGLYLMVGERQTVVVPERIVGRNDMPQPVVGFEYCLQVDTVL